MTIKIDVPEQVEARLNDEAAREGIAIETLVEKIVAERFRPTVADFDELIKKIARPLPVIPPDKQTRKFIYED